MVLDLRDRYGGYYWGTGCAKNIKTNLSFRSLLEAMESQSSRVRLVLDKDKHVDNWTTSKARPFKRQSWATLVTTVY